MALGSNIAERSRKTDIIIQLQVHRVHRMPREAAAASTKGYWRKTVGELAGILEDDYRMFPAGLKNPPGQEGEGSIG